MLDREVSDIIATLARSAMSCSDAPADLSAGLVSTGRGAGTFIATCEAGCFGAVSLFAASASFGASAARGATAIFGAGGGGAASAAREATPVGSEASKRSLNWDGVSAATVSDLARAAIPGSAAKASLTACAALRVATFGADVATGSS